MAPSGLHLLGIFMVGLSLAHWTENPEEKKFCSWKCLLFVLQWPGSFCVSFDPSECRVPSNISDWTIHGLWPLKEGMCCSCWHIFHSDLKELNSQLDQLWPSLLKKSSSFDFWRNEWRKHGVCAACVEGWNSPQRYFQIILELRARYDITGSLDSAGIKPSCNHTYERDQIYGVLAPVLGDHVVIQCMQDDKGRELLMQVKILLSRNLTLGCDPHQDQDQDQDPKPHPPRLLTPSPGHPCPKDTPLFYLPINHDHPHSPCG